MAVTKAELKNIKALKTKKGRRLQDRFAVGGVRLLEESVKFGFLPEIIMYSKSPLSQRGKDLVGQFMQREVPVNPVSNKDLESISDTESSQGIIGVFRGRNTKLSKLYKASYRRLLLCDGIADPGNLGTLARSALAFGFDIMLVSSQSVEVYNPKVVRSSAGAMFGLPVAKVKAAELEMFVKENKAIVIAAEARQRHETVEALTNLLKSGDPTRPVVLAVGSEVEGLSDEVREMADYFVTIEHGSKVDSLNAAVAGSILMQQLDKFEIEK